VPQDQAEAHAEAARDFIMAELVTKSDLRTELLAVKQELQSSIAALRTELRRSIETLSLRLTIRFGAMSALAIWVFAILTLA
jgi:hypothetical protein